MAKTAVNTGTEGQRETPISSDRAPRIAYVIGILDLEKFVSNVPSMPDIVNKTLQLSLKIMEWNRANDPDQKGQMLFQVYIPSTNESLEAIAVDDEVASELELRLGKGSIRQRASNAISTIISDRLQDLTDVGKYLKDVTPAAKGTPMDKLLEEHNLKAGQSLFGAISGATGLETMFLGAMAVPLMQNVYHIPGYAGIMTTNNPAVDSEGVPIMYPRVVVSTDHSGQLSISRILKQGEKVVPSKAEGA